MRRLVSFVVVLLVLAACGGDDAGSGGGGGDERELDRCSLVSAQEAEEWIGVGTAQPSEGIDGEPDLVTCLYANEAEDMIILVQVYDGEVYFAEKGSGSRVGGTDVADLGEDAFYQDGAYRFKQNDWSVSVARISGLIPDESLLEMAELIESRLP
ncbi:MAG: hypothetical protein WBM90_14670 [Acidimicrobiia bacterium]